MAIVITAQLAKKVPLPGSDFSSHQVSVSITGEVTELTRVPEETARLLELAEASVDQKLGLTTATAVPPLPPKGQMFSSSAHQAPRSASASSTPYPSSSGRRAPANISAAQLRFLRQLLDRTPGALERILAEHRVTTIEALSSRSASVVIDQLKAAAT